MFKKHTNNTIFLPKTVLKRRVGALHNTDNWYKFDKSIHIKTKRKYYTRCQQRESNSGPSDLETDALTITPPRNSLSESQIVMISTAQLHTEKWLADVYGHK